MISNENYIKSNYKIAGTMTRRNVADYLYGLKMFLAKQGVSQHEKELIEAEITAWENIKQVSTKIVGK